MATVVLINIQYLMYSFTRTATLTANIGGTKGEVGGMKSPYSMTRNQELNKIQSVQHNQVLKLQGRGQGNACSGQGSSGKEYPSPVHLFRRALLVKAGGSVRAGPEDFHQEKDRFTAEGSSSGCSPVNLVFSV